MQCKEMEENEKLTEIGAKRLETGSYPASKPKKILPVLDNIAYIGGAGHNPITSSESQSGYLTVKRKG